MAFIQYLNFNGRDLPLPISYDLDMMNYAVFGLIKLTFEDETQEQYRLDNCECVPIPFGTYFYLLRYGETDRPLGNCV